MTTPAPHPFEDMPIFDVICQMLADGYKLTCEKRIGQAEFSGYFGQTYYIAVFSKYGDTRATNELFYGDDPEIAIRKTAIFAKTHMEKP